MAEMSMREMMDIVSKNAPVKQNLRENLEKVYTGKTKGEEQSGNYDTVTVTVKDGRVARGINNLADELDCILEDLEVVKETEKEKKNQVITQAMERIFDAGDEAYKRVIQTEDWIMTISKATEGGVIETPEVNVELFVEKLVEEFGTKMAPKIKKLAEQCTTIKQTKSTATPGRVYKPKRVDESYEMIKHFASRIFEYATQLIEWFGIWDRNIDNLVYDTGMDKILPEYQR